jgi:hypothetical protein
MRFLSKAFPARRTRGEPKERGGEARLLTRPMRLSVFENDVRWRHAHGSGPWVSEDWSRALLANGRRQY